MFDSFCRCLIAAVLAPFLLLAAVMVLVLVRPLMVAAGALMLAGALLSAICPSVPPSAENARHGASLAHTLSRMTRAFQQGGKKAHPLGFGRLP